MHPFWKVTVLLLTHVLAIVGVALWVIEDAALNLQQAAYDDPWYRVGLHLSPLGRTPPEGLPPIEEDLNKVREQFPASTRPIVGLLAELRGIDSNGALNVVRAQRACRQLEWDPCDEPRLRALYNSLRGGWR